ncbi:MAG TPA: ATP-binding cassette domain-containing protein, partial [Elusimicrobiales bacterium]|nr:ATP-binding cassette domain-containing protein [Elusimicrobiales bacterium]
MLVKGKMKTAPLLKADGIGKSYEIHKGFREKSRVTALDQVSLDIEEGKAHGIVGESGCGKTTLAKILLGLETPDSGLALFRGTDISKMTRAQLLAMRREVQVVFQDPYSSLDPRMSAGELIAEPLQIHGLLHSKEAQETEVARLLQLVGLSPEHAQRYPHEFSGGQRQRIGIARALALGPRLLVADEAVSALDVSIQAQVLNLLKDLREKLGIAYLVISHDLAAVKFLCEKISVMYLGRIVEDGPADALISAPLHPFTELLLNSVPSTEKRELPPELPEQEQQWDGNGCRFKTRCRRKLPRCEN